MGAKARSEGFGGRYFESACNRSSERVRPSQTGTNTIHCEWRQEVVDSLEHKFSRQPCSAAMTIIGTTVTGSTFVSRHNSVVARYCTVSCNEGHVDDLPSNGDRATFSWSLVKRMEWSGPRRRRSQSSLDSPTMTFFRQQYPVLTKCQRGSTSVTVHAFSVEGKSGCLRSRRETQSPLYDRRRQTVDSSMYALHGEKELSCM